MEKRAHPKEKKEIYSEKKRKHPKGTELSCIHRKPGKISGYGSDREVEDRIA
jgi:hypothetical protein